jgi:hypothetical protein
MEENQMAINVSFAGATIYRPGAYSKTNIDLGGNIPLGPAGLVAIFGEADAGTPGASEVDIARNFFTADRYAEARAKYRSGPILDALNFLFAPAADGAIANGAQTVWVYKTNASVRASRALIGTGWENTIVRAMEWGTGSNRVTLKIEAIGATRKIILSQKRDLIVEDATVGDNAVITLTSPDKITVTANKVSVTVGSDVTNFDKAAYKTINQLVEDMRLIPGIGIITIGANLGQKSLDILDYVTAAGIVKMDAYEVRQFFAESQIADLIITSGGTLGLPDAMVETVLKAVYASAVLGVNTFTAVKPGSIGNNIALAFDETDTVSTVVAAWNTANPDNTVTFTGDGAIVPSAQTVTLSGGIDGSTGEKGGTASHQINAALSKFQKFHVNFVVPLFSRDALEDIADELTESSSSYTIEGIHQDVKNHISLMKTTKKRSERQGFLSLKDSYANCVKQANVLADGRLQLMIQDVRQVDSLGSIKWIQPWALACMIAGARSGASIGLPLTFKFINCSGIRQTAQSMNTPEANIVFDFDPDTMYEDAIQNGITFLEAPTTGGFRVVVDNTTYGVDDNWVWNRGNVIYAADIVAYNFRNTMERRYVGVKNTVRASEVKSTAESVLATFLAQGITVSTGDAQNGFKDLSVRIEGNTIYITVTIKLVEGIDFVLNEITIQRATQSA